MLLPTNMDPEMSMTSRWPEATTVHLWEDRVLEPAVVSVMVSSEELSVQKTASGRKHYNVPILNSTQ